MERDLDHTMGRSRTTVLVSIFVLLVAPFVVLMLSGTAEWFLRALYALSLGMVMVWAVAPTPPGPEYARVHRQETRCRCGRQAKAQAPSSR